LGKGLPLKSRTVFVSFILQPDSSGKSGLTFLWTRSLRSGEW
jgi:hypothetical protein